MSRASDEVKLEEFAELLKRVGRRIYEARFRAGLTEEELATRLECAQASVNRLEAGLQGGNLHLFWRAANVLGLELWELFYEEEPDSAV